MSSGDQRKWLGSGGPNGRDGNGLDGNGLDETAPWWVATKADLRARGVTEHQLRQARERGHCRSLGRGVYLFGPMLSGAPGWHQQVAAMALKHPQGVFCGQSAAALLGLDGFDPPAPLQLQLAPGGASGLVFGLRRQLLAPPIQINGVAATSVEETLLGLGEALTARPGCGAAVQVLDPDQLVELAVEDALRRGLTTTERLSDTMAMALARRAGTAVLGRVLAGRPRGARPTGSYLETRCHQVLHQAGVADFERQVEVRDDAGVIGIVDFARDGVVIEVVGERWHLDRFNPDHRRYARLTAAGHRLLTFTFNDIERRAHHVADATVASLNLRGHG